METWVFLTTWLALMASAGSPPSDRTIALSFSPLSGPSSPKQAMVSLLDELSGASTEERIAVARVAGLGKWAVPELPGLLAKCAQSNRPEAAACIMALVARGDVEELPAIRKALRFANDPAIVASGCLALSAFSDGHSRSLVMLSLLRQRGGTLGGMACAGALDRLNKWTNARYQLFAWRFLTLPSLRQFMATQVLRHSAQAIRTELEADQLDTAARILALQAPSRTELEALLLASCSLAHGSKSAAAAAEARVDPILRGLPPSSPGRCALCQQAVELCGLRLPACQSRSMGCPIANPPKAEPDLRQKIRILHLDGIWSYSAEEWDAVLLNSLRAKALGLTEEKLRPLLKDARVPKRRLAEFWSPESLLDTASSRHPRPIPWGKLNKRFANEVFSEDFLKFEPPLKRPEWLSPNINITIDDGPSLINLPSILESLDRHGTKAVFFFVGVNMISHYATRPEAVRKLIQKLLDAGHVVGYHTMEHALTWPNHIVNWDLDQVVDDADLFRMVLNLAADRSVPVVYGRSPGGTGTYTGTLRKAFQMAGLKAPVGWNREFRSNVGMAKVQATAQALVANPVRAIVLMHEYFSTGTVLDAFLSGYYRAHRGVASTPTPTPTLSKPTAPR